MAFRVVCFVVLMFGLYAAEVDHANPQLSQALSASAIVFEDYLPMN
jgi:hypothetical protein